MLQGTRNQQRHGSEAEPKGSRLHCAPRLEIAHLAIATDGLLLEHEPDRGHGIVGIDAQAWVELDRNRGR